MRGRRSDRRPREGARVKGAEDGHVTRMKEGERVVIDPEVGVAEMKLGGVEEMKRARSRRPKSLVPQVRSVPRTGGVGQGELRKIPFGTIWLGQGSRQGYARGRKTWWR